MTGLGSDDTSFAGLTYPSGPSISGRLSLSLILTVSLVVAAILYVAFTYHYRARKAALEDWAENQVGKINDTIRQPLWNLDHDHIHEVGTIFAADDLIQRLSIGDEQGVVLFEADKTAGNTPGITKSREIWHGDSLMGKVTIVVSEAGLLTDLKDLWITAALTLGLALIVIALATNRLLALFLRRPIESLEQGMDRLAAGDFSLGLECTYRELDGIARRHGAAMERVRGREESLRSINAELEKEIRERRAAESQLALNNALLMTQEDVLRGNEARYRTLFEDSPISLWEEDCSEVKNYLDGLRPSVSDFRLYFDQHPEAVLECVRRIKVLDVSQETVRLMKAGSREALLSGLDRVLPDEAFKVFGEELVALANGKTRFNVETVHRTFTGETLDVSITVLVPPGSENTWDRVYVSIMDITDRKRAEEAARMMQFAIDGSRDAVFWINPEGRFLYVNQAACASLGYTQEELLRMAVYDIDIGPAYPQEVWEAHWQELERRKSFVFESKHKRKDGTFVPVEVAVNLLVFEGRQFNCAFARDITERRQAEELLRRANLVLENSPAMLFRWRAAPGWPVELVSENIRQLGYSPDQVLSGEIPFASMVYPDDLARVAQEVEDHIGRGDDRFQQQYRVVCGDGQVRWVDDSTFVERDETGQVTHFQGIVMDISDRKSAEEALQASEAKFRLLFENMTEGVALQRVILDSQLRLADYRVLDVNPAFETHTGMSAESVCGALASEIFGEGGPPFLEEFSQVVSTGRPFVFETFLAPLQRYFQISAFSPGEGLLATVLEDITRRKRDEEELRQKTEEMERFVYTISHDLKSPLVTIQSFLRFLEQDIQRNDEPRVRSDMEHMRNATKRMSRLLEELLELSRIGRKVHPHERVSLQTLVAEALEMVAGRVAERGVQIEITPDPIFLTGDRMRLVEVFQNLLDNAAKFTGEQATPKVRIGAVDSVDGLTLYVKDNGKGIDPRHLGKIFGLFEKLEASTEGTGVGLALVKRIIETHSGRIWVESAGLGQGVTFFFTLPGTIRQT